MTTFAAGLGLLIGLGLAFITLALLGAYVVFSFWKLYLISDKETIDTE